MTSSSSHPDAPPGGAILQEPKLHHSIGSPDLHRRLADAPLHERYLAWHDQSDRLISRAGLEEFAQRATRNYRASVAARRLVGSADVFRSNYMQEVRNNYALLLAVAPDMNRSVEGDFLRIEGLAALESAGRNGPVVLLGSHMSAYHSAAIALATRIFPIHLVTAKPPPGIAFEEKWSHFGALAELYVDPARGNPIPTILVPDIMAPVRSLRALRRREPVWLAIDTDVGVASKRDECAFMGHSIALPRAFYELALRERAAFFSMDVARRGPCHAVEEHRFEVTLSPLATPEPDELQAFHGRLLAAMETALSEQPHAWTLWRYWDRDLSDQS